MRMKPYTLDQVQDKLLGKVGTKVRDRFEAKLCKDLNRALSNKANNNQLTHGSKPTSNF
jgi:HTH-type transcriptional regulator / antitoxin HipB